MTRRPPPALRHVITHWVAFAAVTATAVVTSAFTAVAVIFLSTATAGAARSELSGRPGSAILVTASATAADLRGDSALVARTVRGPSRPGTSPGLSASIQVSVQSGILNLPGGTLRGAQLQTQIISLPALASHISILSGDCDAGVGYPVPACVPQAAARVLGLRAGDQITVHDPVAGTDVRVLITGIFRPVRLRSPYWLLDPLGAGSLRQSSRFTVAGPLVTSMAAADDGHVDIQSAAWLGLPDFSRLGGTGLAAIASGLSGRIAALPGTGPVGDYGTPGMQDAIVTTGLPGELAALATALVVARTQLLAAMAMLLVVAGATLALAVRLLAQRREGEAALLAARGASRAQLAARGLLDAGIVAVLAATAGPLLGAALAPLLIRPGTAASAGLPSGPRPATATWPAAPVWLASAAVAVGCVVIVALPWLRRPPSPLRRRASRGRQRPVAAAVYARADLGLVVVAAGAGWQLVHSASPVSTGLSGTLSADPILVLAPVLALVAGALLTLRAMPLAVRLGDRLAARGRGLILPFAAWQISRQTLRQTGPALVAVLAVAAAVMAAAQADSWHTSVQAQASFDVGADLRVTLPPAAPLPLAQVTRITRAPGVAASMPALRATFNLPDGNVATLVALDSAAARAIIPPQAAGPSPAALRQLSSAVPLSGVRLPGRPAALRLTARLSRAALAQPVLFVQLTDAAGIGYLLRAGGVPADGRDHALTVGIAGDHADYPLRLTGVSLQFATPARSQPALTLTISPGLALSSPQGAAGSAFPVVPPGARLIFASLQNPGSTAPSIVSSLATPGGAVTAVFRPGQAPPAASAPGAAATAIPGGITLSASYPGAGRPLPAVVTRSFLTATGLALGEQAQATVDNETVPITPVAAVDSLPTVTDGTAGVLIDDRALAAALQAAGAQPESITEWWLRTSGRPALAGLPPGTTMASRAAVARSLLADPLSLAGQRGLLGIAIAAVLLAIIGLLVSVATAAQRARDMALLDALGMPPGQVARLLATEQALTAVTTAGIGMLFGAALSELIIPALTLTAQATRPIPPIAVEVPWLLAAAVALAVAAVPTLAVTLSWPRRTSVAARMRLEDEA